MTDAGYAHPGEVLKRLRTQRGWSLGEVADRAGLSASFLSNLERGESDIALGRLAKLAAVFEHDIGSFLGFSVRQAKPYFLRDEDRMTIDRGPGVTYQVLRLPGTGLESVLVDLAPHTSFDHGFSHEGVDITIVTAGTVAATYHGITHTLERGTCVMWSGGYAHAFANTTDQPAQYVGVITATVF